MKCLVGRKIYASSRFRKKMVEATPVTTPRAQKSTRSTGIIKYIPITPYEEPLSLQTGVCARELDFCNGANLDTA
jgi:hypothetical protein